VQFDRLDPRILPQMRARVAFLGGAGDAGSRPPVVVPRTAVRKDGGRDRVWVVRDGRVEGRAVTVGDARGDEMGVVAGLAPGDRVVVDPPSGLADGVRVRERQP
jgi:multidrug efflux pump subunit AcrA (membrane-fusion protein)